MIEAIAYAFLYSAFTIYLFKVQGAKKQFYNYPLPIQQRALEKGVTTKEQLEAQAKKNKTLGIIVMVLLSLAITCGMNHQFTFFDGFIQGYIFFNAFSLFDALVIDSIWFCHGKWWVIEGTEDRVDSDHDYAFHWKWFFIGVLSSIPLALILGGLTVLIGLI